MVGTQARRTLRRLVVVTAFLGTGQIVLAQSADPIPLVVKAGTPLSVALDERVRIERVGQRVSGTIVNPVYAYDRIVVPTGAKVLGVVAELKEPSVGSRVRGSLGGDFTPARGVVLVFDTLVIQGSELPIHTIVTGQQVNVTRLVAGGSKTEGSGKVGEAQADETDNPVAARARDEVAQARAAVKQRIKDALSAIKQPGKAERLKQAAMSRLPVHRQYLAKGTVYTARLESPLDFDPVPAVERAPPGASPVPGSVLSARLVTALDSAKTPRGSPVVAVMTEPVYSSDHQLIFAEGTEIRGTVTFAKPAARFHRNGRLRFLFERVMTETEQPDTLLASLYSVQTSADEHVALDDEGGASIGNPKTRFIAPVLAVVMLGASAYQPGETPEPGDVGGVEAGGYSGVGGVALSVAFWGLAWRVPHSARSPGRSG